MWRWWSLGALCLLWPAALHAAPTGRFPDPPGKSPSEPKPVAARPAAHPPAAKRPPPAAPAPAESWATRSARLLSEQADALARRGEFARALTVYHQAIVMDPSFAEAYFGLGKLRQRQGDTQEAERIYTQAARLRNAGAKAFELRARLRYVSGRQSEALVDLAESLRLEPEHVPRLELASQWYVAQQAWPAALAVWRRLLGVYRERGQDDAARRAQIQVQALTMLAGDSDPVSAPNHTGWVPNALRHISLRGG
ncbi:MAG: tetratricopeptide repeat protein [Polyangiaceae bacterium]|nr:tetratricopeptide repeat protein [Polyangiaceae bacterium]